MLAIALVATAVAAIQIIPSMPDNSLANFVKLIFAISALSGFLYILFTAAFLKFSRPDVVGNWPFTEKFRRRCYNYCIDSYGVQIGSVIMFGSAYIFGWSFDKSVWDWRVGVGALLTLSMLAFVIYVVRYRKH